MKSLSKITFLFASITAVIYILLFLFFDRAVDLWIHYNFSQTLYFHVGTYISYLANGSFIRLGFALSFILIIIADPKLKWKWTRYLLYICISGAIAVVIGEGLKYLLARHRPVMLFDHNIYQLHFFSSEWVYNSTPSGHTLRAFSLLTALSLLYKRFTVIFISIAVVIGLSRVIVTAHYPSDVVFGAFIGIFTSLWTYKYFYFKYNILRKKTF